jgi:hypothetical protein
MFLDVTAAMSNRALQPDYFAVTPSVSPPGCPPVFLVVADFDILFLVILPFDASLLLMLPPL